MPFIEQLVRSIDGRLEALQGEIASLEEARLALLSNGSPPTSAAAGSPSSRAQGETRRGRGRSTGERRRSTGQRGASTGARGGTTGARGGSTGARGGRTGARGGRTGARGRTRNAERLPQAVEQILTDSDGLSAPELAERAGARRDQVLEFLRELESSRRARRSGHGRGTRWHLMTEEDWIRQRAADLAARSRRRDGRSDADGASAQPQEPGRTG